MPENEAGRPQTHAPGRAGVCPVGTRPCLREPNAPESARMVRMHAVAPARLEGRRFAISFQARLAHHSQRRPCQNSLKREREWRKRGPSLHARS